jgi:hypothetical protein
MRAIIIDDKDAVALVDKLKLVKLSENQLVAHTARNLTGDQLIRTIADELHGRFHYEVVRWLQEQGARVTP